LKRRNLKTGLIVSLTVGVAFAAAVLVWHAWSFGCLSRQ
jgi:hypothetical protein